MNSSVLKAAPKPILQGVRDDSGGTLPVIPEQIPSHLPHIFGYAEKGPEVELVSGSQANQIFGANTFDYRKPYANHQTVLANTVLGEGNAIVFQRIKPADAAPPATLTLSLDIVADLISTYERNADGSYELDVNGLPVPTGATVPGFKMKWVVGHSAAGTIGARVQAAGTMTDTAGQETSDLYPIGDLQVSSFGEHGNLKGIRLWAPTNKTVPAINADVVADQATHLFRMQMIERPDAKSQPNVIQTDGGSQSIEFSFKEGAMNTAVDQELFIDTILLDAYRNLDVIPKQYGPFNSMHIYHDNIRAVLDMIFATEQPHQADWPDTAAEGRYLVNFVSAKDVNGNPYETVKLLGTADGGADFTPYSNYYAAGGSDGTMSFDTFDALVANQVANYGTLPGLDFLDSAMWPQSHIYDTGFSLETKKKLLVPLGKRKDMIVVLTTQDVSEPQNTAEQESSIAIALRAAARLYPESEVFGTPVCRAVVVGHSGYLLNSQYRGLLPLTIELAAMSARFMGAGNGIWKDDRGFDTPPYNQVTMFKDVNCTYKQQSVYDSDWDAGLVWVQKFDRRSLFFPAIQTVYDDSTSVLNSYINACIVTECEKVAERVWRELTGTSKLTREQFIERSNELIIKKTDGRFDDRVIIEANTYFTGYDQALGYSWSTDITTYLNNMVSVGTFTVVAKRRADFISQ